MQQRGGGDCPRAVNGGLKSASEKQFLPRLVCQRESESRAIVKCFPTLFMFDPEGPSLQ